MNDVAERLPSEIRAKVFFSNNSLLILFALSVISLFVLGGYIFDGRQGFWVILSITAVAFSVIGFVKALNELAKIEIENSLIAIIAVKGEEYLTGKSKNERDELDDLFTRLSKKNESQPAINRLIKHIIGEARMNKFDSGINLIEPYKDESVDIIFSLQNYQKIALWIGIAGTFIGILQAMQSSQFKQILESGKSDDFVKVIPLMFDGLVVSFSASLAGLFSAVIIGCLILIVRRKHLHYFLQMEGIINTIVASVRKSQNKSKFLTEIDLLKEDLNSQQVLTKEMQNSNYQLQEIISEMQEKIIQQNDKFQESVTKFFESNDKIRHFAEATEKQMEYLRDSFSLKDALEESITSASTKMSSAISSQASKLTEQMTKFRETTDRFNNTVQSHNNLIKDNATQTAELNRSISSSLSSLGNAIRNLKLPQNLAFWVVGLTLFLGIALGLYGASCAPFSSELRKLDNTDAISNTAMSNLANVPKSNANNTNNKRF